MVLSCRWAQLPIFLKAKQTWLQEVNGIDSAICKLIPIFIVHLSVLTEDHFQGLYIPSKRPLMDVPDICQAG